jgi:23S rRNA-/tRNA-specific pseudouridylate synthase
MSKKDNKINDDISNLMAQGVNQSLSTATALDLARHKKKKSKSNGQEQHFYELSPWKVEPQTGRTHTGRVIFQKKKPKMRHGAY